MENTTGTLIDRCSYAGIDARLRWDFFGQCQAATFGFDFGDGSGFIVGLLDLDGRIFRAYRWDSRSDYSDVDISAADSWKAQP
jgi:hypothetical protein